MLNGERKERKRGGEGSMTLREWIHEHVDVLCVDN
jgi:hypothetical protein